MTRAGNSRRRKVADARREALVCDPFSWALKVPASPIITQGDRERQRERETGQSLALPFIGSTCASYRRGLDVGRRSAWDLTIQMDVSWIKGRKASRLGAFVHLLFLVSRRGPKFMLASFFATRTSLILTFLFSLPLSFSRHGGSYFWRFLGGLLRRHEATAAK